MFYLPRSSNLYPTRFPISVWGVCVHSGVLKIRLDTGIGAAGFGKRNIGGTGSCDDHHLYQLQRALYQGIIVIDETNDIGSSVDRACPSRPRRLSDFLLFPSRFGTRET